MRKVKIVVLWDTMEIIAPKGVNTDSYELVPTYEIWLSDLSDVVKMLGLSPNLKDDMGAIRVFRGGHFTENAPLSVMGEITNGVLHLQLERDDYFEHRSYNGKFEVFWEDVNK